MESVTMVAAPLLAGGSVAMIGLVAADTEKFRWPGPALLLLALSVVLLVACVQWAFRARPYLYSMAEVEDWRGVLLADDERARLVQQREEDLERWRRGTDLASAAYTLGLITLGIGVALVLAPPVPEGAHAGWRWAAFWVVFSAVAAELMWSLLEWGDLSSRALEQQWWLWRARARQRDERGRQS
ncbi:hypothetical protein ACFV0C_10925 [Streptomyces sp. NPDC059568]|uniref:hypothetical protein n=1 Tax=Streptomyces sp. NPDC059568 TaxID=3346868 RepID=UPI00369FE86F